MDGELIEVKNGTYDARVDFVSDDKAVVGEDVDSRTRKKNEK